MNEEDKITLYLRKKQFKEEYLELCSRFNMELVGESDDKFLVVVRDDFKNCCPVFT